MASLHDELLHAARVRMIRNIDTTDRLIRQLYIRAAKRIEAQIGAAKPGSLTERWLVSYKAELEKEIDRLGRGLYDAVYDAAREAAEDRVEAELAYMDAAAARAGTGLSQRFVDTLSAVPTDTLRAMFEGKLYTDGRMLSQRIWAEEGRLQGNIAEIIQQGIAQQTDPLTLARHLEAYVNPKAACPVSWHTLYPSIPFDRKIDYNALRLARTSIIHAHWIAGKAAAKKNPLCAGMKWNLSNQHYERQVAVAGEDVCDEYARHDEGLGRGVFPVDGLPLPHPNCLCYQTEVVPTLEDAVDRLAAWDGTNDPALNDAFEKWRKENAAELDQLHEKWNRELGGVDKGGESATMDLQMFAKWVDSDLQKQETASIRRGIRNQRKNIDKHKGYIQNPRMKCGDNWDGFSEQYRNGLMQYWEKEIRNANLRIERAQRELRRRGEDAEE